MNICSFVRNSRLRNERVAVMGMKVVVCHVHSMGCTHELAQQEHFDLFSQQTDLNGCEEHCILCCLYYATANSSAEGADEADDEGCGR